MIRPFPAGVVLGAGIWLTSPLLTGFREPWDAPGLYYTVALVLAGLAVGAAAPRRFWLGALGLLAGQLLVFAFHALLPPQELWVLGLVALVVYGVWGLGAAAAGAVAAVLVRRVLALRGGAGPA